MAARVTIGGADHLADLDQVSPVTITLLQNGRSRMRLRCASGYTPARFEEIVAFAQDGVTPIYGGVLLQRAIEGLAFGTVPSRRPTEAVGYEAYLDWVYIDLSFPTDTDLQTALEAFIAALPPSLGITLDATDYSGIPLAAFEWRTMRASDGLRELCDRTGRVYRVAPLMVGSPASLEKVLSMPLPGGVAAPVTITDAAPHCRELTWRDPATPPATTVKVLCGTGTAIATQRWVCTGAETSWQTPIPAVSTVGVVWVDDGVLPFNATVGDGASFEWDAATHTLSVGTYGTPAAGVVLELRYYAIYPFTVTATLGGSPAPAIDIQQVVTREDVFDFDQGQEIANGLLAQSGASPRELEIISLEHGWAPGQAVVVNLTGRDINATCAVTEVEITWVTGGFWEYRIKATELSVFPGNYLDQWRALLQGSSSGGGASASSSSGTTVLSNPAPVPLGGSRFHAVQLPAVAP